MANMIVKECGREEPGRAEGDEVVEGMLQPEVGWRAGPTTTGCNAEGTAKARKIEVGGWSGGLTAK